MDSLTELFFLMDDFCQEFEPALEKQHGRLGCNPSDHCRMRTYTRARAPGATYFFTVNLAKRHGNDLLIRHIDPLHDPLHEAFRLTKQVHPFVIEAMVVLPDHLHCL